MGASNGTRSCDGGIMQIIWHIILTVCLNGSCATQDVQWFDSKQKCEMSLGLYKQIPPDGSYDTIEWICKPKGSKEV